jgi:antitoxin YefM
MDVVSLSDTQVNLDKLLELMDRIVEDHAPVGVTRERAEAVVLGPVDKAQPYFD